jgi:hypothetical protein
MRRGAFRFTLGIVTHRRRTEPNRVAMSTFDGVGLLDVTGSLEVFEAAIALPGPFDVCRCGTDEGSTVRCPFGVMLCQGRWVLSVVCWTDVNTPLVCEGRAARRLKAFSYSKFEAYGLVRHATTRNVRVRRPWSDVGRGKPAGSHVGWKHRSGARTQLSRCRKPLTTVVAEIDDDLPTRVA